MWHAQQKVSGQKRYWYMCLQLRPVVLLCVCRAGLAFVLLHSTSGARVIIAGYTVAQTLDDILRSGHHAATRLSTQQ